MKADIYCPGEKLENDIMIEKIRNKINTMLNWKKKGFPGSNPVSLTNFNVNNIFKNDYIICEKTDGVRYFLFVASGTTFFIDRNYTIFKNDIHIPMKEDLSKQQQLTLLDGELVEDIIYNKEEELEEKRIVYLIYDGLYIQRNNITNLSYLERLSNVYNDVIIPLRQYRKKDTLNAEESVSLAPMPSNKTEDILINKENIKTIKETETEKGVTADSTNTVTNTDTDSSDDFTITKKYPIEIYMKDFYSIDKIEVLTKIMKKLPHSSDGIIFTPLNDPYVTGNCYTLLKWKPLNLNTVDFGIAPVYDKDNMPNNFELFISVKGVRSSYNRYLAPYGNVFKQLLELALENKIYQQIVECYYVTHAIFSVQKNEDATETLVEGGWVAQKIRFDKTIPNDIKTINKVIQSIQDNITLETLVKEITRNKKKN